MKKNILLTAAALVTTLAGVAQWQPAGDRIRTQWGEKLDPQNVLPEYPRPQMVRGDWQNLNGLWDYAILPIGQTPDKFQGQILVPFAVESSLSGVGKSLGKDNELWYNHSFTVPAKWNGKRVLLHFGAVDWKADVWVNGVSVGSHTGGYTPFEFDITSALKKGANDIRVRVWDPTDDGYQPRGKQVNRPEGIWYTPVSGIWQTVWLEAVPQQYIKQVKTTPDLDRKSFRIEVPVCGAQPEDRIEVALFDGDTQVAKGSSLNGAAVELSVAEPKLWSPESPFLYDMKVSLVRNGKKIDEVESYTAMRKFSIGRDADDTDGISWHLFVLNDQGQALATCRLVPAGHRYAEAAIGRLANAAEVRGTGMGRAIMQAAIDELSKRSPGPIRISAQQYLQKFYESLGFEVVSQPYLEDDIPHVEMLRTGLTQNRIQRHADTEE